MPTHPRHATPGKRRGRPRQFTPAERRHRYNASRRRRWKRIRNRRNEQRREQRFRFRSKLLGVEPGFTIVTRETLKRPPLLFIDAPGRLFREDFRSAQQLIRDWQKNQQKHIRGPEKGHRP